MARGIVVTCYLPIARGRLGEDLVMTAIAERHDATPEQVALAFELAKGYAAIPTSSRPDRIRANFAALAITLTPEEIATIETLDRGARRIDPAGAPAWD